MRIQILESPLGALCACWSSIGLCSLAFGEAFCAESEPTDSDANLLPDSSLLNAVQNSLCAGLIEYFEGGEFEFPLAHCDWTGVPAFHRKVLERCAKIKRGQRMSYGQLACAVGSPKAARAVGQAMARNRWPLLIPCHRVLGRSGRLTGYSGAGGIATKKTLLEFESGKGLSSALSTHR